MTFLRILNAFCVHLCPSLGDTYSTNLCISLAFYVHLALQCSLARAFSVHLIGRVLSSEFWPELQFLAQFLPDFGGIMLTSF